MKNRNTNWCFLGAVLFVFLTASQAGGAVPLPWQSADIGAPALAGTDNYNAGTFTMEGAGSDIWGTSDQFRFVYRSFSGNGSITARVTGIENTNGWAKAGVMIRQSLAANSANAAMVLSVSNGTSFQRRITAGGTSTNTASTGAAPYWVRLTKSGNTFAAYRSSNGTTWTQVGTNTTVTMTGTVYIGLAVTSHNTAQLCTATFDNVTATIPNNPPVITSTAPTTATEETLYTYNPTATDADANTLTWSLSNAPAGMTINASTGAIAWTPTEGVLTSGAVTLTVNDGNGGTATQTFTVTVTRVNDPPVISGSPATSVNEASAYSFTPTVTDPDNTSFTFSIVNRPSWANFSTTTGTLAGTPGNANVGTTSGIVISVSDGQYSRSLPAFDLTVVNINQAPLISGTPATSVIIGQSYNFTPTASDGDGDALTFSIANQPVWANFNPANGNLGGIPTNSDIGTTSGIVISVSDGTTSRSLPAFNITVSAYPAPTATISASPISITAGAYSTLTWSTSNADTVSIQGIGNVAASGSMNVYPTVTTIYTITAVGPGGSITANATINVTATGLPSPWQHGDVGAPALAGTAGYNSGTFSEGGAGADIYGTSDQFHFIYRSFSGNGSITARVASIGNTSAWAKAGVMIRQSLAGNSINAFTLISRSNGTAFQRRTSAGGTTTRTTGLTTNAVPYWVRITRSGNTFSSYRSSNGSTWTQIGTNTTITMTGTVYIGLAVTSNNTGQVCTATFDNVTVTVPNSPPIIGGTPGTSVRAGSAYSFTPSASDPDNNPLTFSIANRPTWASFNAATGNLSGTPTTANIGTTSNIVISVSDGQASASLPAFNLTVTSVNTPPVISGSPPTTVTQGTAYSFTPTASDANNDPLTFGIVNRPSWASFNTATGALTGTPGGGNIGTTSNIVISVSDGQLSASLPAFNLTVTGINTPPVISGAPATTISHGTAYNFTPTASDPENDPLTFSIVNRPSWASFNTATGALTGTPGLSDIGTTSDIVITVSDGQLSALLPAFNLTVTNTAPVISGTPVTSVVQGAAYGFTPTASDANSDPLTFSIVNQPSWASFNNTNGALTGTPGAANVGVTNGIVISVSDGQASASLPAFDLIVTSGNTPPVISGTPPTSVAQGTAYSFTPTASDADGNTLTFSIVNRPSWASFNTTTGALTGTPGAANVGVTNGIVISVSDGQASVSLPAFSLTVINTVNKAPVISGTPVKITARDMAYSFTPTAWDANGDPLTFTIVNRPGWAAFSTSTGTLSGTPLQADIGTTYNVVISVSDGKVSTSLPAFNLIVTEFLPTISFSASPALIRAGQSATLTWTTSNANSVSIDPGIGPVASSGSMVVSPLDSTRYTISAGSSGGTATRSVDVVVQEPVVVVKAIDAGGPGYMAIDGTVYEADAYYSGGAPWKSPAPIANTQDDALYQTERYGNVPFVYNISLPNGAYNVVLHMAEVYYTGAGQQVFNVSFQGARIISNLDIYAEAGRNVAYDETIAVLVTNNNLNIIFTPVTRDAVISGIKITAPDEDYNGIRD